MLPATFPSLPTLVLYGFAAFLCGSIPVGLLLMKLAGKGDVRAQGSGNIGEKLAVFEPTHGSAPKYAGKYKVNPIATILAAKMMVDWLGEKAMASKVESAVAAVIEDGKIRTYDMRGSATTLDMARAIAAKL